MTSVKEFRVAEPATALSLGRGRFVFTDAYSVFDWGQMPDDVPRKGASLCVMGAYNFEELAAAWSIRRPSTPAPTPNRPSFLSRRRARRRRRWRSS
mgnify:CR=1 FL=1